MKVSKYWILLALAAGAGAIAACIPDATPDVGAVVVALAVGYLATFSACQSTIKKGDSALAEAEAISKERLELREKQKRLEDLSEELKKTKAQTMAGALLGQLNPFADNLRSEEDIQADIDQVLGALLNELRNLPAGADDLIKKIQGLIEVIEELKKRLKSMQPPPEEGEEEEEEEEEEQSFGLRPTVPGLPESATRVVGLGPLVATMEEELQQHGPVIRQKIRQLATLVEDVHNVIPVVEAARGILPVLTARDSSFRAVGEAFEVLDAVSSRLDRMLHAFLLTEFTAGFIEIDGLTRFLEIDAPVSILVTKKVGVEGPALHARFTYDLDAQLFNGFEKGDLLALELPHGFHLTAPVELAPSPGVRIETSGNAPGSSAVVIEIVEHTRTKGDRITLRLDQEINVEGEMSGPGELRAWNLREANGVVIAVVTVSI